MRYCVLSACLVAMLATGCRHAPWMAPPGPIQHQQNRAVVHDPYPQNDIAPAEAAARPRDYEKPLPLPVRNRIVPDALPWLGF